MPFTRNRAHAPTSRIRHRSPNLSTASIPSDEIDSADEGMQEALGRGNMAAMLGEYQRSFHAQPGDEMDHIEDEEDGIEEGDLGR